MKVNIILSCILFSILLSNCEEEQTHPREYPRIRTLPVSNISDSGAVFLADLYSLGSEEIIQHGFIWGNTLYPSIVNSDRVFLGIPQKEGIYSANIKTTLKKGAKYTVMSFVKTKEHTVFGIPETFVSSGSQAPVITGFEPDSASWGDTIIIRGRNFSWLDKHNVVKLDNIQCETFNTTDTTIFAKIPNTLTLTDKILSVAIDANIFTFLQKKLRMEKPLLYDFLPKQARWGDTIIIKGRNLSIVDYSTNSVKLGTLKCSLIGLPLDSIVKVQVPYDISTLSNNISVNLNGIVLNGKQNLQLLEPYFTFSPAEGTWGSVIKLVGRFNTRTDRNFIYLGNYQATIKSTDPRQLEILVPSYITTIENVIKYKVSPFEINSSLKFSLKPPEILSFSPSSGSYNTLVTIVGNNFGSSNTPIVKFGTVQGSVTSWNGTQIKVYVPDNGNGLVKISVSTGVQNGLSTTDFNMQNVLVTGIYPTTGTFKDQVTITGENFIPSGLTVQFGTIYATVKSATSTSVIVEVPNGIDSIPRNIKVTSGSYASSAEKFSLLPHEIYSVTPSSPSPGSDIVIAGKNFNPDINLNKVFLDLVYLTVKSATATQIVATLPQSLPRGNHRIGVRTGGYVRYSTDLVTINSPWLRIASPAIVTKSYLFPIGGGSFTSNNYLCSLYNGATYRFDETSGTFARLSVTPGLPSGNYYTRSVNCQNKLYIFYGRSVSVFNEVDETWSTINVNLPYSDCSVLFSANNKIYYGDAGYTSNPLYEIDPSSGYTVKTVSNIQPYTNYTTYGSSYPACFSWNNKGYVIFPSNAFYSFDPSINSWSRLADFPGAARSSAVSFVLGGYLYCGTGQSRYGGNTLSDFWRYDPLTNSWSQTSSMPVPRSSGVAFTVNGKAYIGYGIGSNSDVNDFYEFDPSLVSK